MHSHDRLARRAFRALNEVVRPPVRAGVANPPPVGVGSVIVETVGEETGEPREVPLLVARWGDALVISTVRPRSQWMANLRHRPQARVRLFGRTRPASARFVRLAPVHLAVLRLEPG